MQTLQNTTNLIHWHQQESLLIWNFKKFYLSNDNLYLRSVFTTKSVSTRSSKLAPVLIYFDKLFRPKSYHPLCTWVINGKCKKLPTLKVNSIRNFWPSLFTSLVINPFWWFFMLRFLFYEKFYMHALQDKKKIHIDLFLVWKFKTFYLSKDNFNLRSIFTNKSLPTKSLKLASMLACFDKLFSDLELSTHLHVSYQPLYIRVINDKCKKTTDPKS
jgi:hypothetical protein